MKTLSELKNNVCGANQKLVDAGLVVLTWGNVSGRYGADKTKIAIKPSGVDYPELTPGKIAVLSLETGEKCEGPLAPSSDASTHVELYRACPDIGGVVHTHSPCAAAWAQAARSIPCLGTTHADTFRCDIPVCRQLTEEEVKHGYERNVGKAIVELLSAAEQDPMSVPAVLVPGHGPFVWGKDADTAVENAIVLEEVARMAFLTLNLQPKENRLPEYMQEKHFSRKHGPDAYYGQR